MESVRNKLVDWTREELIGLIERMVHSDYALSAMIDAAPPGRGQGVDTAHITEQLDLAFQPAMRGGWRESMALAPRIEEMAELGFRHLEHGETGAALAVFSSVSAGILERLDQISEDESEVGISVDRCMEGLGECLGRADGVTRFAVLDAILAQFVVASPWGLGQQGDTLLADQTTPEERRRLAEDVERRLAAANTESEREMLGRFVLELRRQPGDEGDDRDDGDDGQGGEDGDIDNHRRPGDRLELTRALLKAHRPDSARKVLEESVDGVELAEIAALFTAHGYPDHAYRSLEARLRHEPPAGSQNLLPVFQWLLRRVGDRKRDRGSRSRWAEGIFLEEPSVDHWMLMREHTSFSRRIEIRKELERDQHWKLVTEICLAEKRYRWAVNRWHQIDDRTLEVCRMGAAIAEGVAKKKPKIAAKLWLSIAFAMVEHGEAREAVDLAARGRDALLAGRHPVLAKRHVALFRSRTAQDDRVRAELERAAL